MSAFVCDKPHIDALLNLAIEGPRGAERSMWLRPFRWYHNGNDTALLTDADIAQAGAMLVGENVASVVHRYPDCAEGGDLPGPVDDAWIWRAYQRNAYTFNTDAPRLGAVEGLKAIQCLAYQSCEHPDWEQSSAFSFLETLKNNLISHLPGYDEADWAITQGES